ncbi:LamB/YcsF family protein [Bacillus horti]|uniref:5-oxoprolinase subunit A n=1 Tax=Caldalkalibacillus horti TaxID=77523 RepID=A0ABT9VZL9_9BACI|nr:5-oxoprolinase subunit PxpA [Bacillus horti]MDQ0166453.1 UPF0271 protein [Bacillus horti]
MKKVDLNCDLGESFGAYTIGQDEEVMKYITSANIACGYHAGDPSIIAKTIELALEHDVQLGAHPSYPDLVGFGRREMLCSPREVYDMVLYQVGAVKSMCQALGGELQHVKPHGALYNAASRDFHTALAIAEAVYTLAPQAILFGLANSEMIKAGGQVGLKVAHEVFADRTYQDSGLLTPRTAEHALLHQEADCVRQVLEMTRDGRVTTVNGSSIPIQADTICIHGDHPTAVPFAQRLRTILEENEITVQAVGKWKA